MHRKRYGSKVMTSKLISQTINFITSQQDIAFVCCVVTVVVGAIVVVEVDGVVAAWVEDVVDCGVFGLYVVGRTVVIVVLITGVVVGVVLCELSLVRRFSYNHSDIILSFFFVFVYDVFRMYQINSWSAYCKRQYLLLRGEEILSYHRFNIW